MATYTPISFAPIIYPAWGKLFEKLPDSQKAEILMAITNYPNYEPKEENFAWPFIKGEIEKQFERFLDRTQKARDARNASRPKQTAGGRGQPQSTVVDERQPTSTMVDHKPEPIPESEPKESKKKSSAVHRFALTAIPSSWLDYAKSARPDLNPEREFQDFRFYFTEGKGSTESRSDRGWNQSWQGWVKRAKETPKPEEKPSIFAVPKEQQLQMLKDAGKYQNPFLPVPDDSDYQTIDISAFKGEQR